MKKEKTIGSGLFLMLLFAILWTGTVQAAVYSSTTVKFGDVNFDGKIDNTDDVLISQHIAATKSSIAVQKHPDWILKYEAKVAADVDNNGTINTADLLLVKKHVAQQIRIITVKFDTNGANTTIGNVALIYEPGRKYEYPELPTVKRDGYEFNGWYTERNGGSQASGYHILFFNDHTLYANYTPHNVPKQGWKNEGGKLYYYDDGEKITGWKKIDGNYYYFSLSGSAITGWFNSDGKTYYFKTSGALGEKGRMLRGWQTLNGKRYYFKKSGDSGTIGRMLCGWQMLGGKRYYFKKAGTTGEKGRMLTGVRLLDNVWCYFADNGILRESLTKSLEAPVLSVWKKTQDSAINNSAMLDGVTYTIRWSNVKNADGYQVYSYSSDSGNPWALIKTLTSKRSFSTSFSHINMKIKAKVRAYKVWHGKKIYGPWSEMKAKTIKFW